jgi:choline dehydrogenase-like flavoprotein
MTVSLEVAAIPEIKVEALVVGSGFGGSVAACRLAQAGFEVLLLERGRRFESGDFPSLPTDDALLPDTRRWAWSTSQGLWDIIDLEELVSAQAAGYGGGSLIYANVHLRPPAQVFDSRWPAEYEKGAGLDDFFDLAAYMLDVAPVTESKLLAKSLVKTARLQQAMEQLNRKEAFFHPPLAVKYEAGENVHGVAQGACTGCGACCTGCPERAKSTLDLNYLALAERAGARAKTQCEVLEIEAIEDGEYRYRVKCLDHLEARTYFIDTRFLFLSAGSIHSTRLLAGAKLKNDEQLKQLIGVGYFPGGDALGIVYDTAQPQAPSSGPTITTTTVHWRSLEAGSFFLLQDGGYAQELARVTGLLRAPAWLGRNRLSPPSPTNAPTSPLTGSFIQLAGEPSVPLRSIVDDLVDAIAAGDFKYLLKPGVISAFSAMLTELKNPLLLPAVVSGTIAGGISDRYFRWFGTRLTPGKWFLGKLAAVEERVIRRLYAGNDGLAVGALRAAFTAGGLPAHGVAAKTVNYDASGAQHRMMLLAMGRDAAAGHLKYDQEKRQLIADLNLHRLAPGYVSQEQLMTDVAKKLGGELRTNPGWVILGKPITVHNQGGCPMSTAADQGVTTPNGQVHGQEGLYVMDAAVFCSSVGVNPSATILAISERNILSFIKNQRGDNWETSDSAGAEEYRRQREAANRWRQGAAARWKLSPPEVRSTGFQSTPLGIKFSETMAGFFTPDVEDPLEDDARYREYETRGRPDHYIEVALRIWQKDLTSFFEDPLHRLDAEGVVKVRLPGEAEPVDHDVTGTLELFAPRIKAHAIAPEQEKRLLAQRRLGREYFSQTNEEATRFLRYSLKFTKRPGWRLEGYKRIRDQPGLGAWRDVSCLFVKLVGPDAPNVAADGGRALVRGAGAIRVDLFAFLKEQVPSVLATGTADPVRMTWATATFAKFFFVSLQRIYLPELDTLLSSLMRKAS